MNWTRHFGLTQMNLPLRRFALGSLALAFAFLLFALSSQFAAANILGDFDGNGQVDSSDIAPLVLALTDRGAYGATYPEVDLATTGDINQDGLFNAGDLAGIGGAADSSLPGAAVSGSIDIFISTETTIGGVSQGEPVVDISSSSAGSLGIWVNPDSVGLLNGVSLDLASETPGVIAFSNSSQVLNPTVSVGSEKRWFEDSVNGYNIETITADSMTNIVGVALDTGIFPVEGEGLGHTSDELYDSGSGAYLFAVIDYVVLDQGGSTNLTLQINSNGIIDGDDELLSSGNVIFGNGDGGSHAILEAPPVPEPTTLVLVLLGMTGVLVSPRSRR